MQVPTHGFGDPLVARLARAGCVDAEGEAAELMAMVDIAPETDLDAAVRRREDGEPLAWIVGSTRFGTGRVRVHPGVYVPRPQTEELARRAAALLPPGGTAVDLATGCGAIAGALRAADPAARVVGIDLSPAAAVNAAANGVAAAVATLAGDRVPIASGTVDVVTAVAPYVPTPDMAFLPSDVQRHEPRLALDGGADGLDLVRAVVTAAARLLRPGGWVVVEVGADQDELLAPTLTAAGFAPITSPRTQTWHDDDGDLRGLASPLLPNPMEPLGA